MHEQTSAPNMIEYSKPIQDPRAYIHTHTRPHFIGNHRSREQSWAKWRACAWQKWLNVGKRSTA